MSVDAFEVLPGGSLPMQPITLHELLMPSAISKSIYLREHSSYLTYRQYVGDVWALSDIFTMGPFRRRGIGTNLMTQFLARVDRHRATAYLQVASSEAPGAMDNRQLSAWYSRFGFNILDVSDALFDSDLNDDRFMKRNAR